MEPRNKHSTLLALTSSALMLPAYQQARAEAQPDFTEVGLRYSNYEEDDISSSKAFGGSSERMEVDVVQFHMLAPVADEWSVALDVSWEDMSGASPWFVGQSAEGESKVVMSGASIEDTRTEVSVTTRYYYDRGSAGFNYTRSEEDDYESDAVGLDLAFDSQDGLTTYSAAISASADEIEPTQGLIPTDVLEEEKDIRSAWVGVTRIVSKHALMRFGNDDDRAEYGDHECGDSDECELVIFPHVTGLPHSVPHSRRSGGVFQGAAGMGSPRRPR